VKSPGRKIQACAISPSNQELAAMTSILSSDLETGFRDRIEYSPELDQLMRKARKASNFLKALSHENRLLLLCLLAERERSVTELETILSLRQSAVSQQLARLRYDGMVDTRRDGKTIYYSLANEDVRRMISVVYDIFCATAEKR
jgi:DNA-binding transcriptional ArsR family regulator